MTTDTIAVIGLGYVGLPLAIEFGKKFETHGFDLSAEKVAAYNMFVDPTGEMSADELKASTHLHCSTDPAVIAIAQLLREGAAGIAALQGQLEAVAGDMQITAALALADLAEAAEKK